MLALGKEARWQAKCSALRANPPTLHSSWDEEGRLQWGLVSLVVERRSAIDRRRDERLFGCFLPRNPCNPAIAPSRHDKSKTGASPVSVPILTLTIWTGHGNSFFTLLQNGVLSLLLNCVQK